MKVLVIATDVRSFLDLKNVVIELKRQNVDYFFLYSQSPIRQNPVTNLSTYAYDTSYVMKSIDTENKSKSNRNKHCRSFFNIK